MPQFDPQQYGVCAELLANAPDIPLGPGNSHADVAAPLAELQWNEIGPNEEMARCCLAGLWFRYGFLERSHEISQDLPTAEGSYWHGIMHRHEPDYSNAKYWFRQVGEHPLFPALGEEASKRAASFAAAPRQWTSLTQWNPFDFVDLCEAHEHGGAAHDLCLALVELEWEMLFDYCYHAANDR